MKLNQIYKCNVCGNIVELIHVGGGQLICCGQPMVLLLEKTNDEGYEKHVPVLEKTENGIKVKVGAILHPMEEKHRIEWIEIVTDKETDKIFLKIEDSPEVEFCIKSKNFIVRTYCNVHGLWKNK